MLGMEVSIKSFSLAGAGMSSFGNTQENESPQRSSLGIHDSTAPREKQRFRKSSLGTRVSGIYNKPEVNSSLQKPSSKWMKKLLNDGRETKI